MDKERASKLNKFKTIHVNYVYSLSNPVSPHGSHKKPPSCKLKWVTLAILVLRKRSTSNLHTILLTVDLWSWVTAHYSNKNTARATFLSNSIFLLYQHMLLLTELSNAELMILWTRAPTCKTERHCLCVPPFNAKRHKNGSAPGKASRWAQCLRFFYLYQVSGGVWFIHNTDDEENDWEVFY